MNVLEQHILFQVGLQFADLITLAWRMAAHLRNIMVNGISDKWLYDAGHLLLELEQLNPQEFKKRVLEASYSKKRGPHGNRNMRQHAAESSP